MPSPIPSIDRSTLAAPAGNRLVREAGALRELPRLLFRSPNLVRLPQGTQNVLTIPGYGTNDTFMFPLRSTLRLLGHDCRGWGLGLNGGEVELMLPRVTEQVVRYADQQGSPVALVGWSLGGVFAREVARDAPEAVTRVITYGTPIIGGPRYTVGARTYGSERVDDIATKVDERNLIPIERPITAIWSRNDAVVDWKACVDDFSPDVENLEVQSTHVGMGIDPDVWSIIAERLADW